MHLTPTQRAMVARAKRYPFDPPSTSYLFVDGASWYLRDYNRREPRKSLVNINGSSQQVDQVLAHHGYDPAALSVPRVPVIASGSNASPTRLNEKYSGTPGQTLIPVIKYQIADLVPAFSAKFASYGSITATLQYAPGFQSDMFVTYLSEAQLIRMHETEAIGDEYHFMQINNVTMRRAGVRPMVMPIYAYISVKGVLQVNNVQFTLSNMAVANTRFAARSQVEILQLAWELLKSNQTLDVFIYENISNERIRRRHNDRLQAHSAPFAHTGVKLMEGPTRALFIS